jgi:predicted alpha/beta-fold hydrolase
MLLDALTADASRAALAPYRAPGWLAGAHAQTIWPAFLPLPAVRSRRERVTTADRDFWDFDWFDPPRPDPGSPLVVLFHGLEGSSRSHYAQAMMAALAEIGWRGVIPHFRGCGGEPNLLPRAYHSGDHEEIGAMLAAIRERVDARTTIHAAGVSLGGSALLNWLGRAGSAARDVLVSAAAVSTPLDLTAAGRDIDRGFNRVYAWHFLATLRPKSRAIARRFPGLLDEARLWRAFSMYAFDEAVTAPLHGFAGTLDYWSRASSKPWLDRVALPTLVLNARNDPFVPGASLPAAGEVSRSVLLEQPEEGGHCGFMVGPFPGRLTWLPQRLLQFFRHGC